MTDRENSIEVKIVGDAPVDIDHYYRAIARLLIDIVKKRIAARNNAASQQDNKPRPGGRERGSLRIYDDPSGGNS